MGNIKLTFKNAHDVIERVLILRSNSHFWKIDTLRKKL